MASGTIKKLIFGCVVTAFFIGAAELVLLIAGVEPLSKTTDSLVGFSGYAPLFKKVTGSDGTAWYETAPNKHRWFNVQRFPAHKAPGVFRIFCLGGSTTYGRPYTDHTSFCGWLRVFLQAAAPDRTWEVINAGGISYASYRVARLMEELAGYEPDLFIIYTGHNEFLERRTYDKIMKLPPVVRSMSALASRLRLYSLLAGLRRAQSAVLSTEVDAMLDRSIGPDDYHRDNLQRDAVLEHFRTSLDRMVGTAERAGAQTVFVTPSSNIGDFSPFKTEPAPGLDSAAVRRIDSLRQDAAAALRERNFSHAADQAARGLARDPHDAGLLYLKGRALRALKRTDEARHALRHARDEDVCPLRAPTRIAGMVREAARQHRTGLVDFEHLMGKHARDGIPGDDLFLDHVHPTIDGHRDLALALLRELTARGVVAPSAGWDSTAAARVTRSVMAQVDSLTHAHALRSLSSTLIWAGKHEEARTLLERAVDLTGETGETHFQKATLLVRSGKHAEALPHYREAVRLAPANKRLRHKYGLYLSRAGDKHGARREFEAAVRLDPAMTDAWYDLGVVLEHRGDRAAAEAAYRRVVALNTRHADAHNNLGVLCAKKGRMEEAVEHFEAALRADPHHGQAARNLARARQR